MSGGEPVYLKIIKKEDGFSYTQGDKPDYDTEAYTFVPAD